MFSADDAFTATASYGLWGCSALWFIWWLRRYI